MQGQVGRFRWVGVGVCVNGYHQEVGGYHGGWM